jgi:hypothetical protein
MGISPVLHVVWPVAMASTVLPLGVTPFLKALLKNLSPASVVPSIGSWWTYTLLAMVCPAAIDLAIVTGLL